MDYLIQTLLRPYRSLYSLHDLGPKHTNLYTRTDHTILNPHNHLLHYSYYQHTIPSNICIIYCHCSSGSRIQGIQYLQEFIGRGWNVCLFDFGGSGISEGEFISLGHYQVEDLQIMVSRMRAIGNKQLLLWGRSMGAVTMILYLNQTKQRDDICACILDSPFASLWSLLKQQAIQKTILPSFVVQSLLSYLRNKIQEQHHFDIKQIEPIKCMKGIDIPMLFFTSTMDQFVPCSDVQKLYKNCCAKCKQVQYIEKMHNATRDIHSIKMAIEFLCKKLENAQKKKKFFDVNMKNNIGHATNIILSTERQRAHLKRVKSQVHLVQQQNKQNRDTNAKNEEHKGIQRIKHLKTECNSTNDREKNELRKDRSENRMNMTFVDRKKAIKCSVAHLAFNKKGKQGWTNCQDK